MWAPRPCLRRVNTLWQVCRNDRASQIAEFALSLPLLVIFVVGIFDFSGALTLKQKLSNAAREGARVAAADPASDLGSPSGVPTSVGDALQVVDNYLLSEKINDCGLAGVTPTEGPALTWTAIATGSGCPSSGLTLTINRGWITPQIQGPTTTDVVETLVTIQYPYQWRFNNVSGLVGGNFIGPTSITTTATAFNEN
jgi:Flp pilus assembly protein TadG